nr:hypothetical protein [Bacteroides intestinalis]
MPADEICKRQNDAYINGVVEDLWKELFGLLVLPESEMSDLM